MNRCGRLFSTNILTRFNLNLLFLKFSVKEHFPMDFLHARNGPSHAARRRSMLTKLSGQTQFKKEKATMPSAKVSVYGNQQKLNGRACRLDFRQPYPRRPSVYHSPRGFRCARHVTKIAINHAGPTTSRLGGGASFVMLRVLKSGQWPR